MLVAVLILAACGARAKAPSSWVADEAPNYRRLDNGLATANAITLPAVPKLAAAGFKTIVDLRTSGERGVGDEAAAAGRSGIHYVNVPIDLATLSADDVREVAALLDDTDNHPLLMHCSSGNRVGAVMALYREQIHGVDYETARREARTVGLQWPEAVEAVERVRREMGSVH